MSVVNPMPRSLKLAGQTIYLWRKKFAALDLADVKRLRALDAWNAKLMQRSPAIRFQPGDDGRP